MVFREFDKKKNKTKIRIFISWTNLAISLALVFPRRGEIKFSVGSIIAIKKEEPKSFSM